MGYPLLTLFILFFIYYNDFFLLIILRYLKARHPIIYSFELRFSLLFAYHHVLFLILLDPLLILFASNCFIRHLEVDSEWSLRDQS